MRNVIKTLSSGTRLLFVEDNTSPSVEITILFKIGSRTDPDGKQGITHLLEHLNFQGTKIRKNNKRIVLEIENLGGQIDAFTGYEHLGFSLKCPADNVNSSIDILFDMVLHSVYPEKEIKKEKKVILEEIKMYEDIPSEKARDTFQAHMFKNNNLGFNIAGTVKTLGAISRKDIVKYKGTTICQENMLISVAGKFNLRDIEKRILRHIDKMNEGPTVMYKAYKYDKLHDQSQIINVKREIAQSNIVLGTYGLKRSFKRDYALRLGNVMLSGGMGSLLFQRIREDLRLAYYINSTHSEYSEIGLFQVEMGVDDDNIIHASEEVISTLKAFADGKFSHNDFLRAKNYLLGVLVTQIETASDLASWNAYNLLHRKTQVFETKEEIINAVQKVTPRDVREIWHNILSDQHYHFVNVGKKELKM